MRILMLVLSLMAFLGGLLGVLTAETVMQEIASFLLFLISSVFLVGAFIVEAIGRAKVELVGAIQQSQGAVPLPPNTQQSEIKPPPIKQNEPTQPMGNEHEANELLGQASRYVKAGQKKQAILTLQDLVRQHPHTDAAEKALRTLKKNGVTV